MLRYRPQDVLSLLLLSEGSFELGHLESARTAVDVAAHILEYAHAVGVKAARAVSDCAVQNVLVAAGLHSLEQVQELRVHCYCQKGCVNAKLGHYTECIEAMTLADRALDDGSIQQRGDEMLCFNLSSTLWACGQRQVAAERWLEHRGWARQQGQVSYDDQLRRVNALLGSAAVQTGRGCLVSSEAMLQLDRSVLEHCQHTSVPSKLTAP